MLKLKHSPYQLIASTAATQQTNTITILTSWYNFN